jgi:hypothetical protein
MRVPTQLQSLVWYFYYSTIGKPERFGSSLGIEEDSIQLQNVAVKHARIRTWAGEYKVLVGRLREG